MNEASRKVSITQLIIIMMNKSSNERGRVAVQLISQWVGGNCMQVNIKEDPANRTKFEVNKHSTLSRFASLGWVYGTRLEILQLQIDLFEIRNSLMVEILFEDHCLISSAIYQTKPYE